MTIPIVNIYEFDITQSSPAFTRHIPSGSIAYVKELGSGSTSDYLDFNLKALKTGGYHVFQTSVIVFRMSSIGNTVFNMRFWTPDQSALSAGHHIISMEYRGFGAHLVSLRLVGL